MAKTIALVRSESADLSAANVARALIVTCCALTLVLAGPVLPF
jgi:hypothetical protein